MTRKLAIHSSPLNRRGAFTLFEMLIVIALIALLAGVAIVNVGGLFEGGKVDTARLFCTTTAKVSIGSYQIHMGTYPTTAQGLRALIEAPEGTTDRWRGPYLEVSGNKLPLDPWKHDYQYRFPGTKNPGKYDVFSLGPDGVESDDDIGNW